MLFPKHLLELLGHLHSLIVLLLADPAGIQKLLDLLARVSLEHLLKLLESLHQSLHPVHLRGLTKVIKEAHVSSPVSFFTARLTGTRAANLLSSSSRVT